MKKLSILLLVLSLFIPQIVLAQETAVPSPSPEVFDYAKAYKDYIFTLDQYKRAHSEYLLARSQYMQAKTLAAQTKARDATVTLLQVRDDVVMSYLTTLRMKLSESVGILSTDREGLYARIDREVTWFDNHKQQIPSAGTLKDLEADSKEAADHFVVTEFLVYEVLLVVPVGKVQALREQADSILGRMKSKVSQMRADGVDTSITERSLIETENKLTRSLDKEVEAQGLVVALQSGEQNIKNASKKIDKDSIYEQTIQTLVEAQQFLKETSSFMKEILRQIMTKQ